MYLYRTPPSILSLGLLHLAVRCAYYLPLDLSVLLLFLFYDREVGIGGRCCSAAKTSSATDARFHFGLVRTVVQAWIDNPVRYYENKIQQDDAADQIIGDRPLGSIKSETGLRHLVNLLQQFRGERVATHRTTRGAGPRVSQLHDKVAGLYLAPVGNRNSAALPFVQELTDKVVARHHRTGDWIEQLDDDMQRKVRAVLRVLQGRNDLVRQQ